MSDHREWADVVVSNVSRIPLSSLIYPPSPCPIYLCLSSPRDSSIVAHPPSIRTLRRSFSISVSIPTYENNPRIDPDERCDARSIKAQIDSVIRRYARASKEFNARRFVRK